jgi:hypothetical protein
MCLTNKERVGFDVTVGSMPLELGQSRGSSCLAFCYGSPASQARGSSRKVPLFCVEEVGPMEKGQVKQEHMCDLST